MNCDRWRGEQDRNTGAQYDTIPPLAEIPWWQQENLGVSRVHVHAGGRVHASKRALLLQGSTHLTVWSCDAVTTPSRCTAAPEPPGRSTLAHDKRAVCPYSWNDFAAGAAQRSSTVEPCAASVRRCACKGARGWR